MVEIPRDELNHAWVAEPVRPLSSVFSKFDLIKYFTNDFVYGGVRVEAIYEVGATLSKPQSPLEECCHFIWSYSALKEVPVYSGKNYLLE